MTNRRTDKPPFSAWLAAERKRHGLKAEEVARRLREAGYAAEDSTYRTWESTRRPNDETVAALERLFETAAPREGTAGNGDLAAAIREQTAALLQLVEAANRRADAAELRAQVVEDYLMGKVSGVPPIPADDQDEIDRFHREQARGARRPVRQENQPVSGRA